MSQSSFSLNETTWSRTSRLVLALITAFLLVSIIELVLVLSAVSDGWNHAFTPSRLVEISYKVSSAPSPLLAGDLVLAIEGVSLEGGMRPRLGSLQEGKVLLYTLTRAGETFDVEVPLVRTSLGDLLHSMFGARNFTATLSNIIFMLVGLFVFALRPGNLAARLLAILGTFLFTGIYGLPLNNLYTTLYISPVVSFISFMIGGAWVWFVFPGLTALALSFPRPKRPMRSRLFILLWFGLPFAATLVTSLWQAATGYEVLGSGLLIVFAVIQVASFLVAFPLGLLHSFRTLHDPATRAQILWFAFGVTGGIGGAVLVFLSVVFLAFLTGQEIYNSPYARWGSRVMDFMFLVTPLSLAFAILRYRLWDIDLIIRRTLVYSLLSITLALAYLGTVVGLQGIVSALTGDTQTALVTALSTLSIAALFTPLRRRIQDFIDRRFYRQKYNAEQALASFADAARSETDLDELSGKLLGVVGSTLQPDQASLWVRTPLKSGKSFFQN